MQPQSYPRQQQYAPQPQQQYAPQPQPQQYAPQPQSQPVSTVPVFADPIVPASEPGPGFGELVGRSVAIFAHSTAMGPAFDKGDPDVLTARFDLYVIDGGTLAFGVAPKATPPRMMPTHTIEPACVFKGQMTSNSMIVRALEPLVGKGQFLIGVIGTLGRGYCINAIDNAAHKAHVQAEVTRLLADEQAGRPLPVATPLNFAAFGQPQQPAQQPQQAPAPNYAPPAQAQQYAPQASAQPHPQAAPAYAPQPWAQQPQPNPAAPAAGPAPMTAEVWATLSPEQQAFYQQSQQAAQAPIQGAQPNPW